MDAGVITTLPEQGAVGSAYDKASLDRFLAAAATECERLQGAIEVARLRLARAEDQLWGPSVQQRVDHLVLEARRELIARRAENAARVENILAASEVQASAIVADAKIEAERAGNPGELPRAAEAV